MNTTSAAKGLRAGVVVLAALALGCRDDTLPSSPQVPAPASARAEAPSPSPLVTVSLGGSSLTLWPFSGPDLSGVASDPVNLLFRGRVDPRQLRAALTLLDGDRSAYQIPFDCTWKDAVGANEATWADGAGWIASTVQLECGDFGPIRFHLRLFPAGDWTVANAHFEVLIPGTNQHEILSWELAEQLVVVDFLRSGLLDASMPLALSGPINPAPSYRTIDPLVYNGLPEALKLLLTGSPSNVAAPVPVATDGQATILNVAGEVGGERTVAIRDYELPFDQVIPKPFCAAGPYDWLLVQGAVRFRQRVVLTPSGNLLSHFQATGSLDVTPVNPLTSPPTPVVDSYRAQVGEHYRNIVTDQVTLVSNLRLQVLIPPSGPFHGSLQSSLRLGPGVVQASDLTVRCGS